MLVFIRGRVWCTHTVIVGTGVVLVITEGVVLVKISVMYRVIVCCVEKRAELMEAGLNTVMVSFHSIHIGE